MVPNWRGNYRAVINIQGLTEDFYPTILLKKNVRTSLVSDPDIQFTYPNIKQFDLAFGDNFHSISNQKNVRFHYSYSFSSFTNSETQAVTSHTLQWQSTTSSMV